MVAFRKDSSIPRVNEKKPFALFYACTRRLHDVDRPRHLVGDLLGKGGRDRRETGLALPGALQVVKRIGRLKEADGALKNQQTLVETHNYFCILWYCYSSACIVYAHVLGWLKQKSIPLLHYILILLFY
jgi:hypothetical protein